MRLTRSSFFPTRVARASGFCFQNSCIPRSVEPKPLKLAGSQVKSRRISRPLSKSGVCLFGTTSHPIKARLRQRSGMSLERTYVRNGPGALSPGDEDVLRAVVVEWFPIESAIESFQAQASDVEKSQPFVLGCPPE